jgi:hypothetical protein
MSTTEFLLQNLQAQANIDDTHAITQERMQKIEMNQKQMEQDARVRAAMASRAKQLTANGKPDAPDVMSMSNGQMLPTDMANPLLMTIKNASDNVQRAKDDVLLAAEIGDPKFLGESEGRLFSEQKEYRLAQKGFYDDMQDRSKQVAQTFAGVDSPQGLKDALTFAHDTISPKAAEENARQIVKALPMGIENATPAQIRAAIAPIANRYTTMGEQLRDKESKLAHEDRVATLEQSKKRDLQNRNHQIATENQAREGLEEKKREFNAGLGRKTDKEIRTIEDNAQKEFTKDPALNHFAEVKKGYSGAKNVVAQIDAHGYRNVTTAEADDLKNQYVQMMNNYRSMVGGKWSGEQIKKYDSSLKRMYDWAKTVGKGTPPSEQTLLDMAAEMKRVYDDTNIEVVKRSLTAKDKVWRRQGDPTIINSPGSLNDALKVHGVDMIIDEQTGDKIVRFGPNKEDQYVLRDKPKKLPTYYDRAEPEVEEQ